MVKSGITPSPLYYETLQPRDPPASATPQVLGLFQRLILRRTAQLNLLPFKALRSAFTLIEGSPLLKKFLDKLFQDLPNKKPTTQTYEYTSVIKYLICEFFYKSVDNRIKAENRKIALDQFQEILRILDVVYSDYTETVGKDPIQKSQFVEKRRLELDKLKSQQQSKLDSSDVEKINTNIVQEEKSTGVGDSNKRIDKDLNNSVTIVTQSREEEALKHRNMGNIRSRADNTHKEDDDSSIEIIEQSKPDSSNGTNDRNVPNDIQFEVKDEEYTGSSVAPSKNASKAITTDHPMTSSLIPTNICSIDDAHLKSGLAKIQAPGPSERKLRPPEFSKSHLATLTNKRTDVMIPADLQQMNSNFTASCSLVQFSRKSPVRCITPRTEYNANVFALDCRFEKWDPYWSVCEDITKVRYIEGELGMQTTPCNDQNIKSLWNFNGSVSGKYSKIPWLVPNVDVFKDGEQRLILRCLPLKIKDEYKTLRADTHLWPKGTLIEVNDRVIPLQQRKQQSHEHSLWKGLSYPLDVTRYVIPSKPIKITLGSKDSDLYGIQLAICEYISSDTLFKRCMASGDSKSIEKLSFEEAKALWQKNLDEHKILVLDDSDDESEFDHNNKSTHTVCSLLCTVSKTAIQVPVRGKKCQHMQCFDLAVYLKTNEPVSGPRWRCAICEDFVAVEDLVVDGFLQRILDQHREDISATREKVRIHRDGTWNLLEDLDTRNSKKRKFSGETSDGGINKKIYSESAIEIE